MVDILGVLLCYGYFNFGNDLVDKTCRSSVSWRMKMYGVSLVRVRK